MPGSRPAQHQALLAIKGMPGPVTVGALAAWLGIKPHSAVGLADRLTRSKLVARRRDAKDGRRVRLQLTPGAERIWPPCPGFTAPNCDVSRGWWRRCCRFCAEKSGLLIFGCAFFKLRAMNTNPVIHPNAVVKLKSVEIGNELKLAVIAGPCQLESRAHAFDMVGALKEICDRLDVGLVYKTSFDKANRTSANSARGMGLENALPIFPDIRTRFGVPVLTDVHERDQCAAVAQAVDVLQIPAFLCRQTDLLVAAAHTGKAVNVKKGQFLAPQDMKNVIAKITGAGNPNVLATERGVSFGYNTLVSDMRALPIMAVIRRAGGVRRHPFGAAAGRAGRPLRRRPRHGALSGAGRGGGRRRRRLHGSASGSRPRALPTVPTWSSSRISPRCWSSWWRSTGS